MIGLEQSLEYSEFCISNGYNYYYYYYYIYIICVYVTELSFWGKDCAFFTFVSSSVSSKMSLHSMYLKKIFVEWISDRKNGYKFLNRI